MTWLKTIWDELVGLFVDDGSFATAIIFWLAACGVILPPLAWPQIWSPVLLFVGLLIILAESVIRAARR